MFVVCFSECFLTDNLHSTVKIDIFGYWLDNFYQSPAMKKKYIYEKLGMTPVPEQRGKHTCSAVSNRLHADNSEICTKTHQSSICTESEPPTHPDTVPAPHSTLERRTRLQTNMSSGNLVDHWKWTLALMWTGMLHSL